VYKNCCFDTLNISQGSIATHLRCSGLFSDNITTNFLLILTVKLFWKLVTKLRRTKNGVIFGGNPVRGAFFMKHGVEWQTKWQSKKVCSCILFTNDWKAVSLSLFVNTSDVQINENNFVLVYMYEYKPSFVKFNLIVYIYIYE